MPPGGGGFPRNPIVWGVLNPPPLFLKMVRGGVLRVFFDADTSFVRIFFGGILLDCTSKVLSLPPIQPLLILSPSLGTPHNARVTLHFRPFLDISDFAPRSEEVGIPEAAWAM